MSSDNLSLLSDSKESLILSTNIDVNKTEPTSIRLSSKTITGEDIIQIHMVSGHRQPSSTNTTVARASANISNTKPIGPIGLTTTLSTLSNPVMTSLNSVSGAGYGDGFLLTTSSTRMAKTSLVKFLILGSASVGKTLILRRMQNINLSTFSEQYLPSIGPDLHRLQCGTIEAIDIGGQERFLPIAKKYCELFTMFMIVFDITNDESFLMAKYWLEFLRSSTSIDCKSILLIANKIDLNDKDKRRISFNLARNLALTYDATYLEISAKMDLTMEKVFQALQPTNPKKIIN